MKVIVLCAALAAGFGWMSASAQDREVVPLTPADAIAMLEAADVPVTADALNRIVLFGPSAIPGVAEPPTGAGGGGNHGGGGSNDGW